MMDGTEPDMQTGCRFIRQPDEAATLAGQATGPSFVLAPDWADHPGLKPVLDAVRAAQKRHHLFPTAWSSTAPGAAQTPTPVVVGVSGGADSVCLLLVLAALAPAWCLSLHVAHLDHALRPTAADDAVFVAAVADALGLPYHTARLSPNTLAHDPAGLEAAARRARYAFLAQVAHNVAATAPLTIPAAIPATVAVGHHQDDQAETLLMHLIGGSGLDGLGAMRWVATLPHSTDPDHAAPRLVRPLLGVDRATLQTALRALGVAWREDATNQDTARLRNQLRQVILPQLEQINPNIHATLARTADLLAGEASRAAALNRVALEGVRQAQTRNRLLLDLDQFWALDLATRRGVLHLALDQLAIDGRSVGADAIDAILTRAAHPASGGPYPLVDGWVWTLLGATENEPRRLSIHRANALPLTPDQPLLTPGTRLRLPAEGTIRLDNGWQLTSRLLLPADLPADWRAPGQPWRAFVDATAAGELLLTTVQPGMRFAPLGLGGHHRSVGDLLTDHKIAPALRPHWPVICSVHAGDAPQNRPDQALRAGDVVWLCGLRISHTVRVQPPARPTRTWIRLLTWQATPDSPQSESEG